MSIFDLAIRDVAELPDRTSPPDQPAMMLVTADELREILLRHFGRTYDCTECGKEIVVDTTR